GVAHRNGHVQNAFGLDHANLPRSDDVCHRAENFPSQLGENFTRDQHGTSAGAIFAEEIDNLGLKPSPSAAAQTPMPEPMPSPHVQLPQSIDAARPALGRA